MLDCACTYLKRRVVILLYIFLISITSYKCNENVGAKPISGITQKNEDLSPKEASVRLPKSIIPLHYDVSLRPFIYGNWTIMGSVGIEAVVKEVTNQIVLNMADIITHNDTAKVMLSDGTNINIINQTYNSQGQLYTATLEEELPLNSSITFKIEFTGLLNDKLVGFYRSTYTDANGEERKVAATQFSPTDARRAFPCMDEPSFKATFSISLSRLNNMTALSNMPIVESTQISGEEGWTKDTFNTTLPMSTYIVGFLICDFEYLDTAQLNHTKFKVWSRSDGLSQAEYANAIAPKLLTYLEEYFSIDFPLPKLDMAAIPDFKFNGMENWGLIMYRETAMLYDPLVTSAAGKESVAFVIAHEIAHQWFGNLVTPHWWSDLWLKEGFASFMGYVSLDQVEPSWAVMDQFVVDDVQLVMGLDSMMSSHPISVVVDNPDQISEIFDLISYRKGAAIIRMMQHFLSESTFRKGLTNYLNDLKYSNAEQDDLWSHLTEAAHNDGTLPPQLTVKEVMDSWTLQMGYPLISVTRNQSSAILTQKHFLLNNTAESNNIWWVPITYTTEKELDFTDTFPTTWINSSRTDDHITIDLPSPDGWIIVNIQETGYYRVNYDTESWNLLIEQLIDNHSVIHETNIAQIVDNSLNIARAGVIDYSIALNITLYLYKENKYVPWDAALSGLDYIYLMLSRTSGFGGFKEYLLSRLMPFYSYIGFTDSIDDPYLIQASRVLVVKWACKLGHPLCVDTATNLFKEWLYSSNTTGMIFPNTKKAVLCTGISAGEEEEWNLSWEKYLNSNIGAEKEDILSGLGCTKELWILARYLDMCFDKTSGIRKQDAPTVFHAIASNSIGKDLAWNYLREHWIQIRDYLGSGSSSLSRLVKSATEAFNTQIDVDELLEFKRIYDGELGSAVRAVDQRLEYSQLNTIWMNKNYDDIIIWLNSHGFSSLLF